MYNSPAQVALLSRARKMMDAHGCAHVALGWMPTGKQKRALGCTVWKTTGQITIQLNPVLIPKQSRESQDNTILHEIAHALLPVSEGHSARWRAVHRYLGGDGERGTAVSEDAAREFKWNVLCTGCGAVCAQYSRRTQATINNIANSHHDKPGCKKFTLTWRQNY